MTKLDVLDGLKEVKVCVGYRLPNGEIIETTPLAADNWEGIEPIYEVMRAGLKPHSGRRAAKNCLRQHWITSAALKN